VSSSAHTTIYVRLLDEGSTAWRPVVAVQLHNSTYRITEQLYDRDDESWEFGPGEAVECEIKSLSNGPCLVAVRCAPGPEPR